MLAARLGVNRVIATDVIRQVLRAFFTHEAMPTVHGSAFEVGGIAGYRDQAERVGTGIAAIVERAAAEGKPVVVEGVHVVPGGVHPRVRERCVLVEALVVVEDPDLHRGHFSLRPGSRPAERYLAHFEEIRRLQDHLWERARSESVAIIDNANVDDTLARLMELVLDAVREDDADALGGRARSLGSPPYDGPPAQRARIQPARRPARDRVGARPRGLPLASARPT